LLLEEAKDSSAAATSSTRWFIKTSSNSLEQAISSQLEGIDHHFRYIHDNDVPNAVDNFIESTNAGGLIAVAHNHSLLHQLFYRSVSRAMAGRVQVPMLSLHDAQK
jgi:hypothetical protein